MFDLRVNTFGKLLSVVYIDEKRSKIHTDR